MSELTTGGGALPEFWSYPQQVYINGQYRSDGMVWMGLEAAKESDIAALKDALGDGVEIDQGTLVGRWNAFWLPYADKAIYLQGGTPSRAGGLGSTVYELQHVGAGDGAQFRKESEGPMWYTTNEDQLVYGIPPENAGCYHKKYMGDGYYDLVEGVEQGSAADKILGKGEFYWDEAARLYRVRN